MQLYRFSPVVSEAKLLEAIKHIHLACAQLCKQSFGTYLPVAGNIGVFCHYQEEYIFLTNLRNKLTDTSDSFNQKYFRLHEPITIQPEDGVPGATYTHLYIRKPDPYRHHVGDIDFYVPTEKYRLLKTELENGNRVPYARLFPDPRLDMIELHEPDSDVLAYVSTTKMEDAVTDGTKSFEKMKI